ncbi:MAG: hypothetical protein J7501_02635 [Bdellovibrio sp.]|nr:hypothetical protein [Bdellovibrio sp.]
MPSRFIFSLRFSSKVLAKLAKLSVAMIFFMTLFRINLFFLSAFQRIEDLNFTEVIQAFVAGVRFDILVFGFLLIPIYFLLLIQAISERWPRGMFYFYKTYFALVWLIVCALSYVDFFFYSHHGSRMRFQEYSSWTPEFTKELMGTLQMNQVLIFTIITLVLLALGFMAIRGLKFGDWKDEYSPNQGGKMEVALRIVLPLLLITLAARGTVEPHHLALEHSEVSNNKALNEMGLNAVWCFDK